MKMTLKRLDEISRGLCCLVPNEEAVKKNTSLLSSHERNSRLCDCEVLELIRLAKLGLEYIVRMREGADQQ